MIYVLLYCFTWWQSVVNRTALGALSLFVTKLCCLGIVVDFRIVHVRFILVMCLLFPNLLIFWNCRQNCWAPCSTACPSNRQMEFATFRRRDQKAPSEWESKTQGFVSSMRKTGVWIWPEILWRSILEWRRWMCYVEDQEGTEKVRNQILQSGHECMVVKYLQENWII